MVSNNGSRRRRGQIRDFYEAILWKSSQDGSYSAERQDDDDTAVLRFAVAYGMQTVQRALGDDNFKKNFDYIEAMACPGSCLNGGGQLVEKGSAPESPREVRERVADAQRHFLVSNSEPTVRKNSSYYTRYHVVPPMQHRMGAAAGVAVQDTQW